MILISKLLSEKDPQYNRKFKHCKSSMSKIAVHLICLISHARYCVGSRCPNSFSFTRRRLRPPWADAVSLVSIILAQIVCRKITPF